jgi:predicted HNH restriction endonuclease
MEKLFTLDFTFSFNPNDDLIKISDIISDVGKRERVLDYIKDRKNDYGFNHPNTEYKFYLFNEEINLPKQMIKSSQNNHCYFTLNDIYSENEVIKSTEKKTIISFKNKTGIPQEVCSDKPYFEGAVEKIIVNKYERNHKARQECLKHYGYKCCICDFNFLDKYGDIAKEIIEVHHLKKISSINLEYKVDPIKDL